MTTQPLSHAELAAQRAEAASLQRFNHLAANIVGRETPVVDDHSLASVAFVLKGGVALYPDTPKQTAIKDVKFGLGVKTDDGIDVDELPNNLFRVTLTGDAKSQYESRQEKAALASEQQTAAAR